MKNVSVKKMNEKGKNALRAVLIVVVLIFATCFALAACATGEEVQTEKVTSASEINRLIAKANFSAENAVRDKMEERYGVLSDYSYNDGRATADIEKDGKSYSVTVEIEVDESNFSVTRYKNATRSGDSLIYTQNGEEVTYSVADKFVVEENGVIYVIDPSEALNTISIAVSDAILTENVDPENPGDPTDPENPDPEEPENPTDPENPDSQIETIDDINVIEQLLSQKDLTIEALAKAAATAFYGQDNVSNLSYQNGIVSGQAKTAEGTVNFSANLDLSATDFEGKFYAGAELSADGKTLSFYQNGNLATLTITEDMAVIETADGVNILDTAAAEEMVANKFETTNNETSVPSQDITFDSWEELMNIEDVNFKNELDQILQKNLFTDLTFRRLFGADLTLDNLDDGTINILKWGFDLNESKKSINAIEILGVRNGYPYEDSKAVKSAKFTLAEPLSFDSIKVIKEGNKYNYNFDSFEQGLLNAVYKKGAEHSVNHESLDDTNQQYFDLCMQLAVNTDAIGENLELAFVTVQGLSSSNDEWGTTYYIEIDAIDLQKNSKLHYVFVFDDDRTSNTSLKEAIERAISSEQFRVSGGEESALMSSSDIIFEFDASGNVVRYTTPQESENQA